MSPVITPRGVCACLSGCFESVTTGTCAKGTFVLGKVIYQYSCLYEFVMVCIAHLIVIVERVQSYILFHYPPGVKGYPVVGTRESLR